MDKTTDSVYRSPCPHFGECGGCKYLDRTYEEQLALKEEEVKDLLTEAISAGRKYVPKEEIEALYPIESWFEGIRKSPRVFGYRNKMEFSFGDSCKDGPLALGLHKKRSFYDIVTVDHCQIVDEDYRAILHATLSFFTSKDIPHYHKKSHTGVLRHLLVRKALHTGEILIDLVTTSQTAGVAEWEQVLAAFTKTLTDLPLEGRIVGILHTVNDAVADIIRDEGTTILYGQDQFTETLLGLRFRVTPFSFFQTNSFGAEVLYETAKEFLLSGNKMTDMSESKPRWKTLYDLYCGTGTITQLLSDAAEQVIGVEIVEEAVAAAKENAAMNGIENCRFLAGDVLHVLNSIPEKPDVIVLDPPRDGIHPKALPQILSYGVENILYISCKPKSFARDLPAFLGAGYRPVHAACVDEFPWTAGVELICLLSRTACVKRDGSI